MLCQVKALVRSRPEIYVQFFEMSCEGSSPEWLWSISTSQLSYLGASLNFHKEIMLVINIYIFAEALVPQYTQ